MYKYSEREGALSSMQGKLLTFHEKLVARKLGFVQNLTFSLVNGSLPSRILVHSFELTTALKSKYLNERFKRRILS